MFDSLRTTHQPQSSAASSDDEQKKEKIHYLHQPEDVENLLAKELYQMSIDERSKIQDEIHGVDSMATTETPKLIQESLDKLQEEIDSFKGCKTAYENALMAGSTYVTSDEFRLKFLRAEFFDPAKAAARFLQNTQNLFRWFGSVALRRPLRYSDLTTADVALLKNGMLQLLNSRDRAGRLVLIVVLAPRFFEVPVE
ncbi:MAG: hypothetical protein SGARI_004946, partial [Bacillariaceae sp.]